ncbi:MAG: PAS domain-containing protein [Nitrospinota bacterium]
MRKGIIDWLKNASEWHLLWISVLMSEIFSFVIVAGMSIYFRGRITYDYMATSAVTAFFVSLVIVFILIYLLRWVRETEKDMKTISERLSFLTENMPVVPYTCKAEGDFGVTFIASTVEGMTGYRPEQFTSKSSFWLDNIHPDDSERVLKNITALFEKNVPVCEYRFKTADGSYIWVEDRLRLIRKPDGTPDRIIGSWSDITKRKKTEKELKRSEQSLSKAQEIARLGNWDINLISNDLTWSKEIYNIFNVKPGDFGFTYEAFLDLIHPDDKELVVKKISQAIFDFRSFDIEHRIVLPNGEERYVQAQADVVMDEFNKPVRMVGTVQNITERKRAEEELRNAKEKAEEATTLKDKFVSLVSHDLKGPLASLLGYLELIHEAGDRHGEEERKRMLKTAIGSGEEMVALIDELLSFGRFKTGSVKPKLGFIDARFFAVNAITEIEYSAEKKDIKLENRIPKNTRIFTDEGLFLEVVRNMASNAVKFCNKGDTITFLIPDGAASTVAVSDTGIGIAPERLEKIFDYESKSSTPGTSGETGTGLGLPLCRDIMETLGGRLWAESEPGKGSVFHAELPFVKPAVMVVDDSRVGRMLAIEYLKKLQVDTVEATNGAEALEALQTSNPQLIITDMMMPVMDGLEFIENLKNNPKTDSIPVVVLSGHDDGEFREKAIKTGADDFLIKPLTLDSLRLCLHRFVDG